MCILLSMGVRINLLLQNFPKDLWKKIHFFNSKNNWNQNDKVKNYKTKQLLFNATVIAEPIKLRAILISVFLSVFWSHYNTCIDRPCILLTPGRIIFCKNTFIKKYVLFLFKEKNFWKSIDGLLRVSYFAQLCPTQLA